jgi:hypothetical protein
VEEAEGETLSPRSLTRRGISTRTTSRNGCQQQHLHFLPPSLAAQGPRGTSSDLAELKTGVVTLYARDCSFDEREAIMQLAKDHDFSVILHCEDHGDFEGECESDLVAFERGTGRRISFMATNNSHEPLLTLSNLFPFDVARLKREFLLPEDILRAEGENMPTWCKNLMEVAA